MPMGKSLCDMDKYEFMIALKMKQTPSELLLTPLLALMFLDFFADFMKQIPGELLLTPLLSLMFLAFSSEFYLVSGIYEEASTSLSDVLHKLLKTKFLKIRLDEIHVVHDEPTYENDISELDNIIEAVGIVFIQANKHIHSSM